LTTSTFELDAYEHSERRMATLAVVNDLEVFKHHASELNASAPSFSVEQLDLHPTPKGVGFENDVTPPPDSGDSR
jgi:hypothetical protein